MQQAYQIQAAPDGSGWLPGAAPLWDSGRTPSGESADVPYGGPPLTPGGRYEWRVRTWDPAGTGSAWSAPASFGAELAAADRTARWIGLGPVRAAWERSGGCPPRRARTA